MAKGGLREFASEHGAIWHIIEEKPEQCLWNTEVFLGGAAGGLQRIAERICRLLPSCKRRWMRSHRRYLRTSSGA